jgi:phage-related protein
MVETIVNRVIPAIADFTSNLGEKLAPVMKVIKPVIDGLRSAFNSVSNALKDNNEELAPFFAFMKAIFNFAKDFLAPVIGQTLGLAFKALGKIIEGVIETFAGFVNKITKIYNTIKGIIDAIRGAGSAVGNFFSGASTSSTASFSTASNSLSSIDDSDRRLKATAGFGSTNITVNGAIDPISTARQIANILNSEATNAGSFSGLGVSRAYLV